MKYTNLIYDFDGTLSDSYPIFTRALLIFLERRGISETYDEALRRLKISVGAALRSYPLEGDEKEISREYRHIREELARQEMKPIDGAEELLRHVVENGGQNFLYTHTRNFAWDMLEAWGLKKYFVDGVTGSDHFPRKPAPDALNHLVTKHALPLDKTLMVGDRDIDVDAGHNAGMKGILLDPDGFYTEYNPDFRVDSLTEIIDVID